MNSIRFNCMSNLNLPVSNNIKFEGDVAIISNITSLLNYNIIKCFFDKLYNNFKEIIFVPGSHDILFDTDYKFTLSHNNLTNNFKLFNENNLDVNILKDDLLELDINDNIIKIYGQSYSNNYKFINTSVYKHTNGSAYLKSDNSLKNIRNHIKKCDILITSVPPFNILDKNLGCKHLLTKVLEIKPKYHIFNGFENKIFYNFDNINFINSNIYNNKKKSIIVDYTSE
jgi:hypothetical protein